RILRTTDRPKLSSVQGLIPHLETMLRLDQEVSDSNASRIKRISSVLDFLTGSRLLGTHQPFLRSSKNGSGAWRRSAKNYLPQRVAGLMLDSRKSKLLS